MVGWLMTEHAKATSDKAPPLPGCGCLVIPTLVIGLGLAVVASGLIWPEHTTFNASTGSHQSQGTTGLIVGGVFTTIGVMMFSFAAYVEMAHWRKKRAG